MNGYPIGDPDSNVRKAADDFFDLVVLPAVEKFGFDVVRADKIPGTGSITEDILRLVQESELCIVDLTGHNPNVFYECGRRHESGRPYIQLIEQSDRIPFDLAGIRTIKYELTDARTVRKAVMEIQAFIVESQKNGFSQTSSGSSMTAISETLARIERRLTKIEASPSTVSNMGQAGSLKSIMQNPLKVLQEAMYNGDLNALVQLLPRLESISPNAARQAAQVCAINGIPVGAESLKRSLEANSANLDVEDLKVILTGLVQYHVARDEEPDGLVFLKPRLESLFSERKDLQDDDKAFFYNQLSMLQHGAKDFSGALSSLEQAVRLAPDELSYEYNLSIIYGNLNLPDKACEAIARVLAGQSTDEDHLAYAADLFLRVGRIDEAHFVIRTLQGINPARAAIFNSRTNKGLDVASLR